VRIDTEKVERLLFGEAIDNDKTPRPYSQWKLRPAKMGTGAISKPPEAALPSPGDAG
jgi:hypothetical protein